MDTGISTKDRAAIAKGLSRLLADTYVVYLKTHNFHWNVEGPMFQTLHQMFMEQYTEAWNAIDLVAERTTCKTCGPPMPGIDQNRWGCRLEPVAYLFDRFDSGGQADSLNWLGGNMAEPLERQGEVRAARFSWSAMYCMVRPRSGCLNTSPTSGGRPLGRNTFRLAGHFLYWPSFFLMKSDIIGCIGKPSRAKRIA